MDENGPSVDESPIKNVTLHGHVSLTEGSKYERIKIHNCQICVCYMLHQFYRGNIRYHPHMHEMDLY